MIPKYSCVRWVAPDSRSKHRTNEQVDRILGFDKCKDKVAVIKLDDPKAKIRVLVLSEVMKILKAKKAKEVERPFAIKGLTPKGIEYQERIHKALEPFHQGDDSYLFNCHERAETFDLVEELSRANAYVGFRRGLQAGWVKEAIECNLGNCGKVPLGGRFAVKGAKRGRKKRFPKLGRKTSDTPLNEEDREIFDQVIKKHLCGTRNRREPYRGVWEKRLSEFYNDGLGDEDPKKRPIPTFRQFRNYIETTHWKSTIKKSRYTGPARNAKGKAKNNEDNALDPSGPGEVYQIDSTRADVWLCVSDKNRRCIGKPTVYLVVDVYTRMIVGVHVTLGAPSYEEACLALINVLEDKVAMCKRFGIKIRPDQWPKTPLCGTLITDRQEFISKNSKFLSCLKIDDINVPSYSGFFKALIENRIGKLMKIVWTFPGADDPGASKDESPGVLETALTLELFTRKVLLAIIEINNREHPDISLPESAFDADIVHTPAGVTSWFIENMADVGRTGDLEYVRRGLLPEATVARTWDKGIRVSAGGVHAIFFDAGKNMDESYFKPGQGVPLQVQYDASTMNHVWVKHPKTGKIFVAPLSAKRSAVYRNRSWAEGVDYQEHLKIAQAKREVQAAKDAKALQKLSDETDEEAVNNAKSQPPMSRAEVLKDLKRNRAKVREIELSSRKPTSTGEGARPSKYTRRYEA